MLQVTLQKGKLILGDKNRMFLSLRCDFLSIFHLHLLNKGWSFVMGTLAPYHVLSFHLLLENSKVILVGRGKTFLLQFKSMHVWLTGESKLTLGESMDGCLFRLPLCPGCTPHFGLPSHDRC